MTDILKELYEDRFYSHWHPTPEYRELARKEEAMWEQIRPVVDEEMIDLLIKCQSDVSYQTNYEWFCMGFRLGARLLMEVQ